jgi:SAM-dependent methyltransferase
MRHEHLYAAIGKVGWLYDAGLTASGYKSSVAHFVRELRKVTGDAPRLLLDAGCGTGQYTRALLKEFSDARAFAFDLERGMVDHARKNLEYSEFAGRAKFFTADVTGPLSEVREQPDVIIASGILEHVPLQSTIENLARLLRPGGWFFHSPVRDTPYGRMVGKMYDFTPHTEEQNISAFTSRGFRLVKTVRLPAVHPASFKEAHIFRKM